MPQLTLRDLPEPVEAHLRERARIEGRSLSKVASDLLAESLGLKEGRRDLGRFAGAWSAEEAEEFDRAMAPFEDVDDEVWR
jgi:plasmid stability protein